MSDALTQGDIIANIQRLTLDAIDKGHEHMILAVSHPGPRRRKSAPPMHVRVAPGLLGCWCGDLTDRPGYRVDVSVEDAVAWLRRRWVEIATKDVGGR